MALSESVAAYEDCYEYYETARRTAKGIRVLLENEKQAGILRMRLHQARVLERRESMRLYERNDVKYGKSENDKFRVSMKRAADGEEGWWVYIEPWNQEVMGVEEL